MSVLTEVVRFAKTQPEQCPVPPEELDGLKEEISQTLNDCLIGAERIRDIVADLHGYSRLDSRAEADVDVNAALDAAIRVSKNLIKHTATLDKDYEDGPLNTYCNFGRLSQVFLNLLTNAAQSFDRSDVEKNRIRVSTRRHGDRINVLVEDNGRGIDDESVSLIFEPFFTQRRNEGGTGLGLSIAKENAQALGGDLTVRSTEGRGSLFTVTLPIRVNNKAVPESGPMAPLEPRRRLLIVDDEPAVLRAFMRVLSRQLDVTTAESPKRALVIARDQTFDFVLCDVMMTEMDGLDFREQLAKVKPELFDRVVFMTGGAFTFREQERLSEVTVPVLQKPLKVKELLEALHRVQDEESERPRGDETLSPMDSSLSPSSSSLGPAEDSMPSGGSLGPSETSIGPSDETLPSEDSVDGVD
jgi:CheY-like chemotaxis protein/anti-sigma regulatory factor (Ser/Thr protein kinase)